MGEEITRWLDAARPALPWALGALALVLLGYGINAFINRARLAEAGRLEREAKQAEQRAEHAKRYVRNFVEPTVALDMSSLVAHPDKAKFNAHKVLADMRERIRAATTSEQEAPDWTDEELAAVKAMTDRDLWPLAANYQPRGVLPRLKARAKRFTPNDLARRVQQIRPEKKQAKEREQP